MNQSLFDFSFLIWFILFFPIIFVTFYVPGYFIVKWINVKNRIHKFVYACVFGLVLWGIQGFVFGHLQLRFLSYAYCLVSIGLAIIFLKEIRLQLWSLRTYFSKKYIGFILLIGAGSIAQLSAIFSSGFRTTEGIKFFGNSAQDGVAHLAYIQSIIQHFPPQEPGLTNTFIRNYHYWTDLVLADLSRVWHIPVMHLYFHLFPIFVVVLVGISAVMLVREWGGTRKMAYWFLFLLYFASDAAYLVLAALGKNIGFYTPAIDSGVLQLLNMPHMVAKLIFIISLIVFYRWIKNNKISWGIVSSVLFAVLFGFKVYFGIFAGVGFTFYIVGSAIYHSFLNRKITINPQVIFGYILFLILALVIFLPNNYGAGGFVYVYLEWPRSLLGVGSIDWRDWWLRRQVYEAAHNYRNLFVLDMLSVIIAFMSIYGTRILGLGVTRGLIKFFGGRKIIFILPALVIFHILGLFTIQSSGGVNVFNFFSVSSFFLSLFSAYTLSKIHFKKLGIIVIVLFVILTIPRSINDVWQGFLSPFSKDYRLVTSDELQALQYIERHSKKSDVIQASPNNSWDIETPYVSFFSKRFTYLSGTSLLGTHNIKTESKKNELASIFKSNEIIDFQTKVKQRGITYIYLQKNPEQVLNFKIDPTYLLKVFENKTTLVYRVQ